MLTRLLFALAGAAASCLVAAAAPAADTLDALLARLEREGRVPVAGAVIENGALLRSLYPAPDRRPLWTDAAARAALLAAVNESTQDGLDPRDYHAGQLQAGATADAGADLLRTDALIRLASHLFHGKVDPVGYRPQAELQGAELGEDPRALLAQAIATGSVAALLDRMRPGAPAYAALRRSLADYRAIARSGGWPEIPEGPSLHPGERSARVPLLRRRLLAGGYAGTETAGDAQLYDTALEPAVRLFQQRHLLETDGIVGSKTLREANVGVERRIDQIRVNLERSRWLLHDLPATYVLVDIAGFDVRYVRDGRELLRSRAAVGRPYRKTPTFRASISYLEFNPSWTVPPTILGNDVLPEIRKDMGYLARRHMRVLAPDGREVDPASVAWTRYSGRNLPYLVRQDPGPWNALGQVKFVFPNPHMVYLHDTPERQVFLRAERAFSSGCIRVEQARRLAELLLSAQGWSAEEVAAAFAAPDTRRVTLKTPVAVLLHYWTVAVENDGSIVFKRDLYDRDAALLAALNRRPGDTGT